MSYDEIYNKMLGTTPTELAVKQSILIHSEITELIRIWYEKEGFSAPPYQKDELMIVLTAEELGPENERQIELFHGVLRKCLWLLNYARDREDKEHVTHVQEYLTMRQTVKDRLENLIYTVKTVLGDDGASLVNTPIEIDIGHIAETDVLFTFVTWVREVYEELLHWVTLLIEILYNHYKILTIGHA